MPMDNIFPFTFPTVVLLGCCFFLHRAIVLLYKNFITKHKKKSERVQQGPSIDLTWLDRTCCHLCVSSFNISPPPALLLLVLSSDRNLSYNKRRPPPNSSSDTLQISTPLFVHSLQQPYILYCTVLYCNERSRGSELASLWYRFFSKEYI
jgi:hypothetical protein